MTGLKHEVSVNSSQADSRPCAFIPRVRYPQLRERKEGSGTAGITNLTSLASIIMFSLLFLDLKKA